jgi:hypothetical protein
VRSGRGLYLSGGTPAVNSGVLEVVNQLVSSGGIALGGPEVGAPFAFAPDAAGGVTHTPNELPDFTGSSFPHAVTGLAPRNVLFTGAGARAAGAVWDTSDLAGGRGRVTLVVHSFWIDGGYGRRLEDPLIENLQAFLQREPDALPGR